jgi:hypothetical protein
MEHPKKDTTADTSLFADVAVGRTRARRITGGRSRSNDTWTRRAEARAK